MGTRSRSLCTLSGLLLAAFLALAPEPGTAGSISSQSGWQSSDVHDVSTSPSHRKGSSASTGHTAPHKQITTTTSSRKAVGVPRDSRGKIQRSSTARNNFRKSNPCPSTGRSTGACKGYVIDHVAPLKRGGPDAPSNMQWQTTAAAKAKDKIE